MLGLIETAPLCNGPTPGLHVKFGSSLSDRFTLPDEPRILKRSMSRMKSSGKCFGSTSPRKVCFGSSAETTTGAEYCLPSLDRGFNALMEDLSASGMLDETMIAMFGEFGRTPKINKKGGRDHWGNLCTLAFSGGGLRMGQVIGRSDRTASVPTGEPITATDLRATLMHTLLDIGALRITGGVPGDVLQAVSEGRPIARLV